MTCRECFCTTGGGDYCHEHRPYLVYPKKDGSFHVDRRGRTRVWVDDLGPVLTQRIAKQVALVFSPVSDVGLERAYRLAADAVAYALSAPAGDPSEPLID